MDQHQHDWQPTEPHDTDASHPGYECTECPATTTACTECGRPMTTTLLVCDPCLEHAKRPVADVARWMTEHTYGVNLVTLRAVRYDRDKITSTTDDARLPFGLDQIIADPEDTRIGALKHPDDAVRILHDWASAWADHRDETTSNDPLGYLLDHTLWAIQNKDHSGWDQYAHETRQVRATVRRLLGIAPVPEPVPCVHCGGRIVRDWTDDSGLADLRRCTGCHLEWPDATWLAHTNAQVLHALPTTHPDTLITTEQARRIYPQLHPATLRKWIQREHVVEHARDVRGAILYRLGDIAARIDMTTPNTGGSAA
jgi:hypothetical protein